MIEITTDPQLIFKINNKDVPGTIYINSKNDLTFVISTNIDKATFTPGQLVSKNEAGKAEGSILYLDLNELGLTEEEFTKLMFSDDKWQFKLFSDERLICMTPKSETITLKKEGSISLEIKNMVLSKAPHSSPVQLTVTVYRVENIVTGKIPKVTDFPVIVINPPEAEDDLSKYVQVTVRPDYIVSNDKPDYVPIYNQILLIIGLTHPMKIEANDDTNFTVTFVYAEDEYGYGALTTASCADVFGFKSNNDWKVTKVPSQRPYWRLDPLKKIILGPDLMSFQFEINNIFTNLRPGPTSMIISYYKVPGYRDGANFVSLEKVPHVSIKSLSISPKTAPLVNGLATIDISWEVYDAGSLYLDTPSGYLDVTNKLNEPKNHIVVNIAHTGYIKLIALGLQLADRGNVATKKETATVDCGIFLRYALNQIPRSPDMGYFDKSFLWTSSPDICPKTEPLFDTNPLANSYNSDTPHTVNLGQPNYIYVRGLNTSSDRITSRIWLYYAPNNDNDNDNALSPQNWKSNDIINSRGNNQNYVEVTADYSKQIIVTDPYFLWTPPTTQEAELFLVAIAENPPLSNPPKSPLPTTSFKNWNELGSFVMNNPNMAWKNILLKKDDVPQWTQTISVTGNKEGGMLGIGFICDGVPTDSFVSVTILGPDQENSFLLPKTRMAEPRMVHIRNVVWPPGFPTIATINWWKGKTDCPKSAVKICVVVPTKEKMSIPQFFRETLNDTWNQTHQTGGYLKEEFSNFYLEKEKFLLGVNPTNIPVDCSMQICGKDKEKILDFPKTRIDPIITRMFYVEMPSMTRFDWNIELWFQNDVIIRTLIMG